MVVRRIILSLVLFSAGLGVGLMASLVMKPAIIVQEKWRTITTAPTPPVVLGHTSLNEDELRTLLTIMETTTTTTVAPSTTSTVPATATTTSTTRKPPETTTTTMAPMTTTLPSETTTSNTN